MRCAVDVITFCEEIDGLDEVFICFNGSFISSGRRKRDPLFDQRCKKTYFTKDGTAPIFQDVAIYRLSKSAIARSLVKDVHTYSKMLVQLLTM